LSWKLSNGPLSKYGLLPSYVGLAAPSTTRWTLGYGLAAAGAACAAVG